MKLHTSRFIIRKVVGRSREVQKCSLHRDSLEFEHQGRRITSSNRSQGERPLVKDAGGSEKKFLSGFVKELQNFLATGQNPNQRTPVSNFLVPADTIKETGMRADNLAREIASIPRESPEDQKLRQLQETFRANLNGMLTEGKLAEHPLPLAESELREFYAEILRMAGTHPQVKSVVERLEAALIPPTGKSASLTEEELALTIDILSLPSTLAHPLLICVFNAVIYIHGLRGRKAVAFYLNQQLTARGITCNALTVASLMNACVNSGDWRCALGLYGSCSSKRPTDQSPVSRYTREIAIKALCLAGRSDEALEAYRGLNGGCSLGCYEALLGHCVPSEEPRPPNEQLLFQALVLFGDCAKTAMQISPATIQRLVQAAIVHPKLFPRAETVLETAMQTMGFAPPLPLLMQLLEICQKRGDLGRTRRYLLLAIHGRNGADEVLDAYVHLFYAYKNHFPHRFQAIKASIPVQSKDIRAILGRPAPTQGRDAAEEMEHVMQHISSAYSHRPDLLRGRIREAQMLVHLKLGCVERALTLARVCYLGAGQLPPLATLVYLFNRCFEFDLRIDVISLWKATEPLLSVLWGDAPPEVQLRVRSQHFHPADTLASLYIVLINGMAR